MKYEKMKIMIFCCEDHSASECAITSKSFYKPPQGIPCKHLGEHSWVATALVVSHPNKFVSTVWNECLGKSSFIVIYSQYQLFQITQ